MFIIMNIRVLFPPLIKLVLLIKREKEKKKKKKGGMLYLLHNTSGLGDESM